MVVPGPCSVMKCGAESTTPLRTMPGNPADTRSASGSGATSATRSSTIVEGTHGYVVFTATRSATIAPVASSTDALSPVPPMSMANVYGASGECPGGAGAAATAVGAGGDEAVLVVVLVVVLVGVLAGTCVTGVSGVPVSGVSGVSLMTSTFLRWGRP